MAIVLSVRKIRQTGNGDELQGPALAAVWAAGIKPATPLWRAVRKRARAAGPHAPTHLTQHHPAPRRCCVRAVV